MERQEKPPTVEEIRAAGGFASTRSVVQYLETLKKAGFVIRGPGPRNLRVLRSSRGTGESIRTIAVPVVIRRDPNVPLLHQNNVVDYRLVSSTLAPNGYQHFLLQMQGDSMNLAGIEDGDLVLVRQQTAVKSGERVVILIDERVDVLQWRAGRDIVMLVPASSNPLHRPIIASPDVPILGVVVASIPKDSAQWQKRPVVARAM